MGVSGKPVTKDTDLTGMVVGDLEVVRYHGMDDANRARLWFCNCSCGGCAIRSTGALTQAFKHGQGSACASCTMELRGGFMAVRKAASRALFCELYQATGLLYGTDYVDVEMRRLKADLSERESIDVGFPDDRVLPFEMHVAERVVNWRWNDGLLTPPPQAGTALQDWTVLFPMQITHARYECVVCKVVSKRGWGCVDCVRFVCFKCGASEVHRCRSGRGRSYDDVLYRLSRIAPSGVRAKKRANPDGIYGFDPVADEAVMEARAVAFDLDLYRKEIAENRARTRRLESEKRKLEAAKKAAPAIPILRGVKVPKGVFDD